MCKLRNNSKLTHFVFTECVKITGRMSLELKNGEEIIVFLILKFPNTRDRLIKMRNNHKIIDIIHAKMYIIRTEVQ